MINLSSLRPGHGARKKARRIGRGPGSGRGKTSGRGHKGQNSRGSGKGPWFEGGQTPLHRRLPKRGFHNPTRTAYQVVNLRDLEARFSDNDEVTPETLRAKGLASRGLPVKLLGKGTLSKKLTVRLDAISAAAAKAVEAAGGTVAVPEKKVKEKKERAPKAGKEAPELEETAKAEESKGKKEEAAGATEAKARKSKKAEADDTAEESGSGDEAPEKPEPGSEGEG